MSTEHISERLDDGKDLFSVIQGRGLLNLPKIGFHGFKSFVEQLMLLNVLDHRTGNSLLTFWEKKLLFLEVRNCEIVDVQLRDDDA